VQGREFQTRVTQRDPAQAASDNSSV